MKIATIHVHNPNLSPCKSELSFYLWNEEASVDLEGLQSELHDAVPDLIGRRVLAGHLQVVLVLVRHGGQHGEQ